MYKTITEKSLNRSYNSLLHYIFELTDIGDTFKEYNLEEIDENGFLTSEYKNTDINFGTIQMCIRNKVMNSIKNSLMNKSKAIYDSLEQFYPWIDETKIHDILSTLYGNIIDNMENNLANTVLCDIHRVIENYTYQDDQDVKFEDLSDYYTDLIDNTNTNTLFYKKQSITKQIVQRYIKYGETHEEKTNTFKEIHKKNVLKTVLGSFPINIEGYFEEMIDMIISEKSYVNISILSRLWSAHNPKHNSKRGNIDLC